MDSETDRLRAQLVEDREAVAETIGALTRRGVEMKARARRAALLAVPMFFLLLGFLSRRRLHPHGRAGKEG
jgi:hypothetical protein